VLSGQGHGREGRGEKEDGLEELHCGGMYRVVDVDVDVDIDVDDCLLIRLRFVKSEWSW
jgi:hypothetical protein